MQSPRLLLAQIAAAPRVTLAIGLITVAVASCSSSSATPTNSAGRYLPDRCGRASDDRGGRAVQHAERPVPRCCRVLDHHGRHRPAADHTDPDRWQAKVFHLAKFTTTDQHRGGQRGHQQLCDRSRRAPLRTEDARCRAAGGRAYCAEPGCGSDADRREHHRHRLRPADGCPPGIPGTRHADVSAARRGGVPARAEYDPPWRAACAAVRVRLHRRPQPSLDQSERENVAAQWKAIVVAGGGCATVDPSPNTSAEVPGLPAVTTVPLPAPLTFRNCGTTVLATPGSVGFKDGLPSFVTR